MTREEAYRLAIRACEKTWNDKTCKQIKDILKQGPCGDCISRQDVHDLIAELLSDYLHDEDREKIEELDVKIEDLPSVTPKENRGSSFGLSSLAQNSGTMIAAVIGGCCFTYLHTNGVFFTAAIFFLLSMPLFLVGIGKCTKKIA